MRDALASIPGRKQLVLIKRAGHDLARGKFDAEALVVRPFLEVAS
jgi:hypothetical protein